jgi:MinD superfamily P-loop ATPase
MKELVVISGKGGTGKTTVVGSFAVLARDKVLADADVDAPNLHLLLSPSVVRNEEYQGAKLALTDEDRCTLCGRCQEVCAFGAIEDLRVIARRCEGCGTCALVCPVQAITMQEQVTGRVFVSDTRYGPLVYARLSPGAEASGRLVTQVRRTAQAIAAEQQASIVLVDGSPGIGCPVIASLTGADAALVVTEPTPSGLHDLTRVLQVAAHFRVPAGVCVNKWDINEEMAITIEDAGRRFGATPVGRVPFDESVVEAVAKGVPVVEFSDGLAARAIRELWRNLSVQ